MGLKGKLISQIEVKCDGDIFHEMFRHKPHHIANITPHKIQGCDLHEGEFGASGSVLFWNYTHEGKEMGAKTEIEEIDEEKKTIKFKVIDGDLVKSYKKFNATLHVDTNGEQHLVTWTIEYEKLSEDAPNPISYLDFATNLIKDIESHHIN